MFTLEGEGTPLRCSPLHQHAERWRSRGGHPWRWSGEGLQPGAGGEGRDDEVRHGPRWDPRGPRSAAVRHEVRPGPSMEVAVPDENVVPFVRQEVRDGEPEAALRGDREPRGAVRVQGPEDRRAAD